MANPNDEQLLSQIASNQKKQRVGFILTPILFLIAMGIIMAGISTIQSGNTALGICIILVGIVAFILSAKYLEHLSDQKNKMKELVGQSVVREILAERIAIEQYNPNQYFNRDFLEHCSILPNYDRSSGSDYISGTYRGVPITYCDLHLEVEQESTDSDGNTTTSYYTVFRGPVINLALRQPLNGYVRIHERRNPRKEKGFFSGIINGAADLFNIDRNTVETENAQFNQQFKVDTSDPQLAFYILTPQFMEHIVQADMIVNGYTNIEFNQGIVTLALNNGTDAFELGKYKKNEHFLDEARQRFRYELNSILGIVDEILTKENLF